MGNDDMAQYSSCIVKWTIIVCTLNAACIDEKGLVNTNGIDVIHIMLRFG